MNNLNFKTLLLLICLLFSNSITKTNLKTFNSKTNIKKFPTDITINKGSLFSNDLMTEAKEDQKADNDNLMDIYKNNNILSSTIEFTLDKNSKSCDVNVKEKVKFHLDRPSNIIDHIIISKKTPYYNFTIRSLDSNVKTMNFDVFQDSSFKQRVFVDSLERKLLFRDRWLISVKLDKPVNDITLEFGYNMQRALIIDPDNEMNYLYLSMINPYPSSIDYIVNINLLNFESIKPQNLDTPLDTLISSDDKELNIKTEILFDGHSEYDFSLNLPMQIETCEKGIIDIVYYGLIVMSGIFVVLSLITTLYIYKE